MTDSPANCEKITELLYNKMSKYENSPKGFYIYELRDALKSGDVEWADKIAARPHNPRIGSLDLQGDFMRVVVRKDTPVVNWILQYSPEYAKQFKNALDYYDYVIEN